MALTYDFAAWVDRVTTADGFVDACLREALRDLGRECRELRGEIASLREEVHSQAQDLDTAYDQLLGAGETITIKVSR